MHYKIYLSRSTWMCVLYCCLNDILFYSTLANINIVQISHCRCTDLTSIRDVHTHLKCNLVNFKIPNEFLYYAFFCDLKIDKITFQTGVYILYSSEMYSDGVGIRHCTLARGFYGLKVQKF